MYSGREQISEAWGMEGEGEVGQEEKKRSQKDTIFWGMGMCISLAGDGFTGGYICPNIPNCTLQIRAVCHLYINEAVKINT